MNCPNCGLANPDSALFCGNCGTSFGAVNPISPGDQQARAQYGAPLPYQPAVPIEAAGATRAGNSVAKNIGIGCLIAVIIFLFLGLSCTRACFGLRHRRGYIQRRY